jgi:hypothetical protein
MVFETEHPWLRAGWGGNDGHLRNDHPEGALMSDRRTRNAPVLSERRAPADDRRSAPRYLTQRTPAVIGWTEGEEHRTIPVSLLDISMGGFSAWVEIFPPRGVPVWVRLNGETPSPWLKACVVATMTKGLLFWSRRQVRLRFLEACTYDFFKAAIEGFSREPHVRDRALDGSDSRLRR